MSGKNDRDRLLMDRLGEGDENALAQLFERHAAKIYGLARRIVLDKQLAEEVLQDTFLRVARDAKGYRTHGSGALPWLTRIARNAAIDILRKRKREGMPADPEVMKIMPDERVAVTVEGLALQEFVTAVQEAITELPEGPRKAIDLAYYAGLTQAQIAEKLAIPLGTVKTWVRTGLSQLRERLARFAGAGRAS